MRAAQGAKPVQRVHRGGPCFNLWPRDQGAHGQVRLQFNHAQLLGNLSRHRVAVQRVVRRLVNGLAQLHHAH